MAPTPRHDQGVACAEPIQARGELGTAVLHGSLLANTWMQQRRSGRGLPDQVLPGHGQAGVAGQVRRLGGVLVVQAGSGDVGRVSEIPGPYGKTAVSSCSYAGFSTRFSGSRRWPELRMGGRRKGSDNHSIYNTKSSASGNQPSPPGA